MTEAEFKQKIEREVMNRLPTGIFVQSVTIERNPRGGHAIAIRAVKAGVHKTANCVAKDTQPATLRTVGAAAANYLERFFKDA